MFKFEIFYILNNSSVVDNNNAKPITSSLSFVKFEILELTGFQIKPSIGVIIFKIWTYTYTKICIIKTFNML